MPIGCSTTGSSREFCSSAIWMRRSTSRTDSRYSVDLRLVLGPMPLLEPRDLLADEVENARPA